MRYVVALVPDAHDRARPLRLALDEQHFLHGVRHWLFDERGDSAPDRHEGGERVVVVRRRDEHRVEAFAKLREHLAVVVEDLGLYERVAPPDLRALRVQDPYRRRVRFAQRYEFAAAHEPGAVEKSAPPVTAADDGDARLRAGRQLRASAAAEACASDVERWQRSRRQHALKHRTPSTTAHAQPPSLSLNHVRIIANFPPHCLHSTRRKVYRSLMKERAPFNRSTSVPIAGTRYLDDGLEEHLGRNGVEVGDAEPRGWIDGILDGVSPVREAFGGKHRHHRALGVH